MGFRRSSAYRILLMVVSLACLVATGYLVYSLMKPTPGIEDIFKQAESSYSQGEEALKAGNHAQAVDRFDTARKQSEQVVGSIEKQREQTRAAGREVPKADEIAVLEAKAHYLRARAIRDRYFAQAAADGKPIADALDTTTGEHYRDIRRIADAKDREEVARSLSHASMVLTKDMAVLKDAIRLELTVAAIEWERLSRILNAILELDPKDSRAHYWLARFDFFQPQRTEKGWVDAEPTKRSLERVERSLRAVRKAKEFGTQPPWRLLDLEARNLEWLAENAQKKKSNQPNKAEDELRVLLLHPSEGALAVVRKAQKFELPTLFDLQGVLTAHLVAARLAARDSVKPEGDRKPLLTILQGFLDAIPKVRNSNSGKANPAEVTQGMLEVLAIAQPVLNTGSIAEWPVLFDQYLDAAAEFKTQNDQRPQVVSLMTDLLRKEVRRSIERGDKDREQKLKKRQAELISAALKDADAGTLSKADTDHWHSQAIEMKLLEGAPPEDIAPHLKALAVAAGAPRPAIAYFAEGVLFWRQGKLVSARESLEASLRYRDCGDFQFGASWLLYQIYAAFGQSGPALGVLRDTEPYFAKPDRFTALDRLALIDPAINADDYAAHVAVANISLARQRITRHLQENPDGTPPADLSAAAEKLADAALKKLKTPSDSDQFLRIALLKLRLLQQRRESADELMKALRRDYPDSIAVLATEANLLSLPRVLTTETPKPTPEGIKEADARIDEFCAYRPKDAAARFFRAEWLARTGRLQQAEAALRDPASLEAETVSELLRALAHLRGYPLLNGAAQMILADLAAESEMTATLIRAAAEQRWPQATRPDPTRIGEVNGRRALRRASQLLTEGRFEGATRAFADALPVSALNNAAREGILRSIVSCAAVDPSRARDLCVAVSLEQSDEPSLYFGAAIAALLLGDLGQPKETWERSKSMAAALNRWEPVAKKTGSDPADLAMGRAKFWAAAGRIAPALEEATRAFGYDDLHPATLVFLAYQALASTNEDGLSRAQKYWNSAVAIDPDDIGVRCLEADLKAKRGDWNAAVRIAQELVKEHPSSSRSHATLVRLGAQKEESDEVFTWARQWLKALPCDQSAARQLIDTLVRRGRRDEARSAADQFLSTCRTEIARQIDDMKPAPTDAAFENWERNARDCTARARGEMWVNIISAFRQTGQTDEAVARLKAALVESPESEILLMLQAETLAVAEQWKEAGEAYQRILAKKPRHVAAAKGALRVLAGQLHDPDAAFRVLRSFGAADPDSVLDADSLPLDLLLVIGEVHERFVAQSHRSELRRLIVESLKRFPNNPRIQLYAGQLHFVMGDGMRASECLQRALRLARAEFGNELSVLERQKVVEDAQQVLDRLREDPKIGNSDV